MNFEIDLFFGRLEIQLFNVCKINVKLNKEISYCILNIED